MEKLIKAVFSCLIIAGFIGCGGGKVSPPELKGKNTAVTITLGGLKASSSSDRTIGRAAIPAVVDHVVFTISAPDITNIVKSVTAAGKTVISESFDVPNGSTRQFFVQAFNISGTVIYEGETSSDLDGTPITLAINLRTVVPWAKSYGGTSSDRGTAIQQTADGGFVVAGTTYSLGYNDIWVVKINNSGVIEWEKSYGGIMDDGADAIYQTSDGGYIISGYTDSFGSSLLDFWLLKLDSSGVVEWEKRFGGSNSERAFSVQQTDDGGFIVAGSTLSFGAGDSDIWVIKLDSAGTIEWQKAYGTAGTESASSVRQTPDGGYIIAGKITPVGTNVSDFLMVKLTSTGGFDWAKTLGTSNSEEADCIRLTADGGFIISGAAFLGAGNSEAWIIKMESDHSIKWQKTFGGSSGDRALAVRQTSDGNYIVAGYTYSFGPGAGDVWVIKLDSNGSVVWQKAYGTLNQEEGTDINEADNGEFIVTGYTKQPNLPIDLWILNLGGNGTITFNSTGGASVVDTNATVADTSVTPVVVSLTVNDTTVNGVATNATVTDTSATVRTQAP